MEKRPRPRAQDKILARPRSGPPLHKFTDKIGRALIRWTGSAGERHRVVHDIGGRRHPANQSLIGEYLLAIEDLLQLWRVIRCGLRNDVRFLGEAGIVHPDFEHEPVQLRLGQRIGSFVFNRVLRREHEERRSEHVGCPARRYPVLLHGLEQRRLRFRRCAVHLVGEKYLGEYRPLDEAELAPPAARFIKDVRPRDV